MQRSFSSNDLNIRGHSLTATADDQQDNQKKDIKTRKPTPRRPHSAKDASSSTRTAVAADEKAATKRPQSANMNNEAKKQVFQLNFVN